ncbi:hypothetical protein [Antarcticirhabdus aurantiaca]|uniref:Uncharacterized protein n=1 Tax=Antarcticirhabdus aurantiaca TaxID=2606717 RepID=A0ACD4NNB3_9HYPH|nr:hypothetical protein OXU80_26730 [Jeongeuplla avenae]
MSLKEILLFWHPPTTAAIGEAPICTLRNFAGYLTFSSQLQAVNTIISSRILGLFSLFLSFPILSAATPQEATRPIGRTRPPESAAGSGRPISEDYFYETHFLCRFSGTGSGWTSRSVIDTAMRTYRLKHSACYQISRRDSLTQIYSNLGSSGLSRCRDHSLLQPKLALRSSDASDKSEEEVEMGL